MLKYNANLIPRAKELRKEMTRHERRLWYDFLRYYPIKVYKQKPIDNFIVDFYCSEVKLVIELDGSQHYTEDGLAYDKDRTNILNALGLEIIRFTNNQIDNEFDAVCQAIDLKIKEKHALTLLDPLSQPS